MSKNKKIEQWTNRHHIIWRSERNDFYVDEPENIKEMRVVVHRALHLLFWWENKPKEQMQILVDLYEPILSEQVKKDLFELLSRDDVDFYNPDLIKKCKCRK